MSGGSYNYAFTHVNAFVDELDARDTEYPERESAKARAALGGLLELVSEAMRLVEWEDSGDTGPEQTIEAVNACFEFARDKAPPK